MEMVTHGTGDPLSKNMDPSPFPPEISIHTIRRYLSAQPKQGEHGPYRMCLEIAMIVALPLIWQTKICFAH